MIVTIIITSCLGQPANCIADTSNAFEIFKCVRSVGYTIDEFSVLYDQTVIVKK
jgi:hypothetical protein